MADLRAYVCGVAVQSEQAVNPVHIPTGLTCEICDFQVVRLAAASHGIGSRDLRSVKHRICACQGMR